VWDIAGWASEMASKSCSSRNQRVVAFHESSIPAMTPLENTAI